MEGLGAEYEADTDLVNQGRSPPPPPASSPNGFLLCLNVSSDQKRRDIPAVSNPAGLIIATDERLILPGVE